MATLQRMPSEQGIRVYATDVLEDLLRVEESFYSSEPTAELAEEESKVPSLPSIGDANAGDGGESEEAGDELRPNTVPEYRPISRESAATASSGSSFWTRNNISPRYDTGLSGNLSKLTDRELERLKAKEEKYIKMNQDYERNQTAITEAARLRREEKFNKMYGTLLEGMSTDGVVAAVEQRLVRAEEAHARKRMQLHSEWNEQVFGKIQGQVQRAVSQRSSRDIKGRLRSQYSDYLKITNEKVGVFRDTIIEADYNPLTAHEATIKYSTRGMEDPLKRDIAKVQKERMELGLVDMLKDSTLGKDTFDTKWWDKTHATPYGYDVNTDGTVRTFKEDPLAAKNKTSRVPFDHYNNPEGPEVPDMEWETCGPRCRSKFAPGPEQRRNRQNLFETFQQGSNPYHDGRTLGDRWLEAKGKNCPPGPEQRRGRPDLFETFQMQSDPYSDGRSLGDVWLERKGKANPPGPEQRRNRQNLFETFQMKTNPYQDGRPLGDLWLEAKGKGMGVPNHSELKNTANFPQTVSHTVREDFVEKRKRRDREGPVNYIHTASNFAFGE